MGKFRTLKARGVADRSVIVAITGTPGTGKRTACDILARRGYAVIDLEQVARETGCIVGRDVSRGSDEVDLEALRGRLPVPTKVAFLRSHYSHRMPVQLAVVLRCRPSELRRRLGARAWSQEKVQENVEAEAIGVITREAVDELPYVYEVDTTGAPPSETVNAILGILQGRTLGYVAGSVDWTDEVLSWY